MIEGNPLNIDINVGVFVTYFKDEENGK